ncbi:hypothetical protein [Streptomyces sp. NPDC058371]|uniref:hypothetical protein n=1 Tax=Streptomyces sp. NPDC058371 TaxID=3346463 RepID=UPI00365F6981
MAHTSAAPTRLGSTPEDYVRFGIEPRHLRFAGEIRVERYQGGALVESHLVDALWEFMYFGKTRA